jgi:hypothetical protein
MRLFCESFCGGQYPCGRTVRTCSLLLQ